MDATSTQSSRSPATTPAPTTLPIKCGIVAGACFLWLLLAAAAHGQIEVPKEAEQHKLISAKLTAVLPEGAYLADGGWEIQGTTARQMADFRVLETELLFTGTPGEYWVLFDGVMLRDVTFKDGDGQQVTIPCYLGRIKGRAPCKIKGGSPPGPDPPVPPDPPGPGGKYRIVLFRAVDQVDNLPQGQRDILLSTTFRDWLKEQGHVLLEVLDPARFPGGSVPLQWQPWVQSIVGDPLPRIAIAPLVESGYVTDYALPKDIPACKALLTSPAVRKAVKLP
jgi:hypothetical protein